MTETMPMTTVTARTIVPFLLLLLHLVKVSPVTSSPLSNLSGREAAGWPLTTIETKRLNEGTHTLEKTRTRRSGRQTIRKQHNVQFARTQKRNNLPHPVKEANLRTRQRQERRMQTQQDANVTSDHNNNNNNTKMPNHALILFILFDEYAIDVGWNLRLEKDKSTGWKTLKRVPPYLEVYRDYRGGETHTRIISLDEYLLDNREDVTFLFNMLDVYGDGLVRGAYYQLNFTTFGDGGDEETYSTEIVRDSHYGRKSSVTFTIGSGSNSSSSSSNSNNTNSSPAAVPPLLVLETQMLETGSRPVAPTPPPTPFRSTPFLRLFLDFPRVRHLRWAVYKLNPENLNSKIVARIADGSYNGRDGIVQRVVPLRQGEEPSYYRFLLSDNEPTVYQGQVVDGNVSLYFVGSGVNEEEEEEDRSVPSSILSVYVYRTGNFISTTIRVDQSTVTVLTADEYPTHSPSVSPTLQPTPSLSEAPSKTPLIVITTIERSNPSSRLLFVVGVPLAILFTGLGILLVIIWYKRQKLRNAQRSRAEAARRDAQLEMEAAATPTVVEQDEPALVGGMRPEERFRYIRDNLLAVSIAAATNNDINSSTTNSMLQCAICLNEFKDGDQVCFSSNPLCEHKFHQPCIMTWLQKNVECPCCRQPYLEQKGGNGGEV